MDDKHHNHPSILHALQDKLIHSPNDILTRWVDQNCQVTQSLTCHQLCQRSATVEQLLKDKNIQKGDRVMIAYPFGLEFLSGLVGCMRHGAIPCSVYPPNLANKKHASFSFEQFNNQVDDAGADFALTTATFKRAIQVYGLATKYKTRVTWLATDNLKLSTNQTPEDIKLPDPNDIAFIQYSSGSTGVPKGIMISHKSVAHNLYAQEYADGQQHNLEEI